MRPFLALVSILAAPPSGRADLTGPPAPTSAVVAQAIAERRSRVAEFQVIKEAAEELGMRVWLFGGTAAGYAHYVRWDLAREAGDPRYRESFFDYDFTNIYRSTQDADLVVDATPEQAGRLEILIKKKMSFLQGSKDHWEVRLLRYPRTAPGGQVKLPLLDNPDFLEQNTDSNSTGMIELTDPPRGEGVVRDLRDWKSATPFFLQDVTLGRLHYYLSPTHEKTSRFKAGNNPPLFSVIRYLVKAFQYDLQIEGEDREKIQAIIDAFDPREDYRGLSQWARGWLERYGPNLVRHAVNIEYAWDTLESSGLRQKLISLSRPSQEDSLGWWLSREPLRTLPVGTGEGETAAELGIEVVAHETSDFLAYESITRDTTLRPNVLISRAGHVGETAAGGNGFYTRRGRKGARGTGLTIRFTVDPKARKGTDFITAGDFVIFRNRAALQVIPESLNLSLAGYFQMLVEGTAADPDDRGVWTKLKRRLATHHLSEGEAREVGEIVLRALLEKDQDLADAVWKEWEALPESQAHPEMRERAAAALLSRQHPDEALHPLLLEWFSSPAAAGRPDLEERLLTLAVTSVQRQITRSWTGRYPDHGENQELPDFLKEWFNLPLALRHPELVMELIERGNSDRSVAYYGLKERPEWAAHPELVRAILSKSRREDAGVVYFLLSQEAWARHPDLLRTVLEWGNAEVDLRVASETLKKPFYQGHPEFMELLIRRAADGYARYLATGGKPGQPEDDRDWRRAGGMLYHSLAASLAERHWAGQPGLVRTFLEALPETSLLRIERRFPGDVLGIPVAPILREPSLAAHPELLVTWARHTDSTWDEEIDTVLSQEPWKENPSLRALCGGKDPVATCLRQPSALSGSDREVVTRLERLLGPSAGEECR